MKEIQDAARWYVFEMKGKKVHSQGRKWESE